SEKLEAAGGEIEKIMELSELIVPPILEFTADPEETDSPLKFPQENALEDTLSSLRESTLSGEAFDFSSQQKELTKGVWARFTMDKISTEIINLGSDLSEKSAEEKKRTISAIKALEE